MTANQTHVELAFGQYIEAFRRDAKLDVDGFVEGVEPRLRRELARMIADYHELRRQMGEASTLLEPGRVLGDYRLVREVGRGGMAVVWEAEDLKLERAVALKLLAPHYSLSEKALSRFEREARAGGRLAHRGIVPTFGAGESHGVHYIVQELVPGGYTLADELHAQRDKAAPGPAGYRRVAELTAKVADALHHAHEAGIVHRDVKPGNVLLTEEDEPRVTDFGLAKIQSEAGLSRTGSVEGTPYYMSPEQAEARRGDIDRRTDVFSLGATFYELLTHRRAFDGDTSTHVFHQIRHVDPADPRTLRSQVPSELATIALKALEKNPERRYATAAEFAADLRRFLNHEPITARPPGVTVKAFKWTRRHPVLAATSAVAVAASVLITVLYLEAQTERARALVSAAQARDAQASALDERAAADEARLQAVTAAHEAAWQSYVANVTLAGLHLGEGRYAEARSRLAAAPPDQRGWEWQHLDALLTPYDAEVWPAVGGYLDVELAADGRWVATTSPTEGLSLHTLDDLPGSAPRLHWRVPPESSPAAWPTDVARVGELDRIAVRWSDDTLRIHDIVGGGVLQSFDSLSSRPQGGITQRLRALLPGGGREQLGPPTASPDGTRVACMAGRRIEVFWLESGESVVSSRVPSVPPTELVFGFDGRVWGALARRLMVFDPAQPQSLELIPGGERLTSPEQFAADAEGRRAFAGGLFVDLENDTLHTLPGIFDSLDAFLLPDGNTLVRQFRGELDVFDGASGQVVAHLPGHAAGVTGFAATLDGQRFATVSGSSSGAREIDGSLRIWNTTTVGSEVDWPLARTVTWVQTSADGTRIALAHDATFQLLDGSTGELVAQHTGAWIPRLIHPAATTSLLLDAQGRHVLVRKPYGVDVRDARTGAVLASPEQLEGQTRSFCLSGDGRGLGVLFEDELRIWDLESSTIRSRHVVEGAQQAALSRDGSFAAVSTSDALHVLALADDAHLGQLPWTSALEVQALAIGPRGERVALADGLHLWLYDVPSGTRVASLQAHQAERDRTQSTYLNFTPDGSRLATIWGDGTLRLWDADSGILTAALDGARAWPSFTDDGQRLICSDSYALRIRGTSCASVRELWPAARRGTLSTKRKRAERFLPRVIGMPRLTFGRVVIEGLPPDSEAEREGGDPPPEPGDEPETDSDPDPGGR